MKKSFGYILLIFLIATFFSCKEKKGIPIPDDLVSEKQMVDILYDIHLNQAYFNQYQIEKKMPKDESNVLYFSVLKKYNVADSTFAQSVIYYSSLPKIYERIYQQVVDRLKMLEEDNSEKKELNIHPEE